MNLVTTILLSGEAFALWTSLQSLVTWYHDNQTTDFLAIHCTGRAGRLTLFRPIIASFRSDALSTMLVLALALALVASPASIEVFHHIDDLHTTDQLRTLPCIPFVSGPLQLRRFTNHSLQNTLEISVIVWHIHCL